MQQGVDILHPPFNGPANHVREVIQELERLGHTVRVLVRLDGQTWFSDDLETFEPIDISLAGSGTNPLDRAHCAPHPVRITITLYCFF